MKTILLTNDDGYQSLGLLELQEELREIARVVVVAPQSEKSACGHGLCITKPLKLVKLKEDYYKLDDGGPADCVYIAMCELFKQNKPDLVISGINIGSNLGEDTTYSGTVAGAMEGCIKGIKSVAVSQVIRSGSDAVNEDIDFGNATRFTKKIARLILEGELKLELFNDRKFLNINIPYHEEIKGIAVTNLAYRIYNSSATKNTNPRGEVYHWVGLNSSDCKERVVDSASADQNLQSDFKAVHRGYISVTPMQLDSTSYSDINDLKRALKEME